jgi:hypothetical protein
MDENLRNLIADATKRTQSVEDQRKESRAKLDREMAEHHTSLFREAIDLALGPDILSSIAPTRYQNDLLKNAMFFDVDGNHFKLQQVTGSLVNLESESLFDRRHKMLAQFNLQAQMPGTDF